jgi:large subunit ribosomal protein L15
VRLNELAPAPGSRKKSKRVGRGTGSGHGKTACRGHKGQKSRTGAGKKPGFEGGQMPLQRRLPKRGFTNKFAKEYAIVTIQQLAKFQSDVEITPELLISTRIVRKIKDGVKLLSNGSITIPLTIKVHKISEAARQKILTAGGTVEILNTA